MIKCDRDMLICDIAETYHIFNIYEFSPISIARLSVGLRDNSRIKMKMANIKYEFKDILLMSVVDHLAVLTWQNTKDAQRGQNKPKSLVSKLLEIDKNEDILSFASSSEFEKARQELLKKGG